LFVYGTLRPFVDIPMARWLRRVARHVGMARTRGRLYDLGRYPGLRTSLCKHEWVVGDLYAVARPLIYRVLDRYEGGVTPGRPSFARERCTVWLPRRWRRAAWVYVYRGPVSARSHIPSGDYQRYVVGG
jgi:gamma-glutamylcyclotransferase (GGCT)/AIG2-like uncharacterized protein YtfP